MKVRVRLFAALREIVGQEEVELELAPGTTIDGLWEKLVSRNQKLAPYAKSINFAVNHDFVTRETPLSPNDEVAFLPPVSGG
ncbi:MAG: molybdopterin converting factor subunit 1 [Vicinamibacteria bacterium]